MIYASTACYTLARDLGHDEAIEELRRQILEPTTEGLPVAMTFARLRTLEELVLHIDAGGTSIARTRARALYEAHERAEQCDVWLTCDDDVEATRETLDWLLQAVRKTRGVVVAPCWLRLRRDNVVNVILEEAGIVQPVGERGAIMPCRAGGFGLVAMHQDAIQRVWDARMPELAFLDKDGNTKCGAFLEVLEKGHWWSEDLSFFVKWLPDDVPRHVLLSGVTSHAGQVLELSKIGEYPRMAYGVQAAQVAI